MVLALGLWAIVGAFVMYCLWYDNYLDDLSTKTAVVVMFICGPLAWILFMCGLLIGFIEFIILLLER